MWTFRALVSKTGEVAWSHNEGEARDAMSGWKKTRKLLKSKGFDAMDFALVDLTARDAFYKVGADNVEWKLSFVEPKDRAPEWWKDEMTVQVWARFYCWKSETYGRIDLGGYTEAFQHTPITDPEIQVPEVTPAHEELLRQWTASPWRDCAQTVYDLASKNMGSMAFQIVDYHWGALPHRLSTNVLNILKKRLSVSTKSTEAAVAAFLGSYMKVPGQDALDPFNPVVELMHEGLFPVKCGTEGKRHEEWKIVAGPKLETIWTGYFPIGQQQPTKYDVKASVQVNRD